MKMLYVVNTKQDADAYRVYVRVHMDGRVTGVNRAVSLVAGLLITAGGALPLCSRAPDCCISPPSSWACWCCSEDLWACGVCRNGW